MSNIMLLQTFSCSIKFSSAKIVPIASASTFVSTLIRIVLFRAKRLARVATQLCIPASAAASVSRDTRSRCSCTSARRRLPCDYTHSNWQKSSRNPMEKDRTEAKNKLAYVADKSYQPIFENRNQEKYAINYSGNAQIR